MKRLHCLFALGCMMILAMYDPDIVKYVITDEVKKDLGIDYHPTDKA